MRGDRPRRLLRREGADPRRADERARRAPVLDRAALHRPDARGGHRRDLHHPQRPPRLPDRGSLHRARARSQHRYVATRRGLRRAAGEADGRRQGARATRVGVPAREGGRVKIGLNTDSLGELSLDAMLDVAAELSLDAVEFPTGAWSAAPHVALGRLLERRARGASCAPAWPIVGSRSARSPATATSSTRSPGPVTTAWSATRSRWRRCWAWTA